MDAPQPPTEQSQRLAPITALLLAGVSLIVIAVIVIVTASWEQFSPMGRILATLLPLLALYAIGLQSDRKGNRFAPYLLIAASVIVPFVTGVLLQQSGLGTVNDPAFLLVVSLVTLSVSLIFEFVYKQTLHTPLTILALFLVPYFATNLIWPDQAYDYSLSGVVSGLAMLLIAAKLPEGARARAYATLGVFVGWLGIVLLPVTFFSSQPLGLASLLLYLLVGFLFLVLAIYYSTVYLVHRRSDVLLVRQIAEQSVALLFIFPPLLACVGDASNPVNALLLLICGVWVTLLSTFISIRSYRVLGYGGIIGGLIFLLFLAFGALQASWPLVLLGVGFIMIGAAYALQHRHTLSLTMPEIFRRWKVAIDALGSRDELAALPNLTSVNLGTHQPVHRSNDSVIVIVAVLVIAFLYAIFSQISQNKNMQPMPFMESTTYPQVTPIIPTYTPYPHRTLPPVRISPMPGYSSGMPSEN